MKKWIVAVSALVVLGISAGYAAPSNETPKAATTQAQAADDAAAKACRAERTSMGTEAFNTKYGTNKNLRNAFGKCVSSKSKDHEDAKDDDDKGDTSAKACATERASIGAEAFAKKYGTNHNLKNAFGKCVSGKSKSKKKND